MMCPLDRLLLILDRTMVLFVGLAAGAVVALSFFPAASRAVEAQASIPAMPAAPAAAQHDQPADGRPNDAAACNGGPQGRPIEIGVFGDSFGEGIWAGLYNSLRSAEGIEVHRFGGRSTGFTRYRSLNLLDDIRGKLDRQPVDIAVVSFGANDTQGIFHQGHGDAYMSAGWQRIVSERVSAVVAAAARARRDGLLGRPAGDARRCISTPTSRHEQILREPDGGARRALYRDLRR